MSTTRSRGRGCWCSVLNDARVRIAAAFLQSFGEQGSNFRVGTSGSSQSTFHLAVLLPVDSRAPSPQAVPAIQTPGEQTNERCGHIRGKQALCWMFSLPPSPQAGAPGLRVSVYWTCSQ